MRRFALTRVAIVAALGCVAATSAIGQAPSQTPQLPTFRTGVRVVEVDVVVRDRDGKFVDNLTTDDFEILEDGEPQEIQHLSVVNLPVERAEGGAATVTADPALLSAESPIADVGRLYVMILDSGPIDRVRTIANQFIEEFLGPSDLMAVVQPYRNAGTDGKPGAPHRGRGAILGGGGMCGPVRPSCPAFRMLEEVAVNLRAVAGRRKAILLGWSTAATSRASSATTARIT